MFATLDQTTQPTERKNNFAVEEELSPEQIAQSLEGDTSFQEDYNKLNYSSQVNQELSEEILAILQDMEGQYHSTSDNQRYINWEVEEIPYQVLRKAASTEAGRLIKNKRRLDLVQYSKIPGKDDIQRGVTFVFSNPSFQPDKKEKMMLDMWSRKLIKHYFYAANEYHPSFSKFLGSAYDDWFDVDDITIEKRKNDLQDTIALHLVDPILYKPVLKQRKYNNILNVGSEFSYFEEGMKNFEEIMFSPQIFNPQNDEPDYLLLYNDRRIMGVNRDLVEKHHFFTRSDFRKAMRGFSVTEQGLNILTYIINSLKHNASNFNNNRTPRGLLAFTGGGVGTLQLEKLKKLMFSYMSGAGQHNRFPMIGLKGEKADAKWIGIDGSSKDMEYHIWMTLLFSIWCQLSGTDPKEMSLGSHDQAVGKPTMFEQSTDGIIKESRDNGIRSFLNYMEEILNTPDKYGKNVFQQITNMDIQIKFLGLEIEDKKLKQDIIKQELQTTASINEKLAAEDKEKQTLMIGDMNYFDVPGAQNPQVYQAMVANAQKIEQQQQMEAQQQMMAQQQGQNGQGEEQLTDADRELLAQYGNEADVEEGINQEQNNQGQ